MQHSEGLPPNHRHRERGAAGSDRTAGLDSSRQGIDAGASEPEFYAGAPSVAPPSYAAARMNYRFANARPSAARRMSRAVARFCVAALIGIGGTLAWQSYGEDAKTVVRTRAPSLAWLVPAATVAPPAAAATTLPGLAEQLKSVALDLVVVRRALEQIAAKSDQLAAKQLEMAQTLATLQDIEQDVGQRISSVLAAPAAAHLPPHKPPAAPAPPVASAPPQH